MLRCQSAGRCLNPKTRFQCKRTQTTAARAPSSPPGPTTSNPLPSSGAPPSGGAGKAFLWIVGLAGVGSAGTLAYAYADPAFRKKIEKSAPPLKPYLLQILGEPRKEFPQMPSLDFNSVKDKISESLPTKKDKSAVEEKTKQKPTRVEKSEADQKVEDSDRKKKAEQSDADRHRLNAALEKRLDEVLSAAERAARAASATVSATLTAIEHHTKLLRDAVEDAKVDSKDPQWNFVSNAYEQMQHALKGGNEKESAARKALEQLRVAVNEGRSSKITFENEFLSKAADALNKLEYEIDEAKSKVTQALTEGKIMTEFKELVMKGREQFANELKSILPHVNYSGKLESLSTDDLNALIAHAHLRVDQIRKQLSDQQSREQQHISQAIERSNAENKRALEEKLDRELRLVQEEARLSEIKKIAEKRDEWEDDMRTQLRRAAAAHSEHLEDVLRVQRENHEIELGRKVEESIGEERLNFNRQVALSMATLQGIEAALDGRAALDSANRVAKELWLACQHLRAAVVVGRPNGLDVERRRKPLGNDMMAVKEAGKQDAFVMTMVNSIPDMSLVEGVYTEEDLLSRFNKVYRLCRRTALIDANGGTIAQYLLSFAQSLFVFDSGRVYNAESIVDTEDMDTFRLLARANHLVKDGDYESAVRVMQLLKGEPGRIAQSWVEDMRTHLETRLVSDLLIAHAAATSVRTVY